MLKSYIPEYSVTSINGSGVIKALQNDSMPELDLLVREAVQNSADAAIGLAGNSSNVSFNAGVFEPKKLNSQLEGITVVLDERFPVANAKYLEIRDSKTVGLTGPVNMVEIAGNDGDHGNYFKLVFENGQEQTNSNAGQAGGSWGYGKSVYYRVGIGLVIFYSRMATDDGFESRLVASLVEHDKTGSSILKSIQKDSIGRAWWGVRERREDQQVFPVTDLSEIEEILDIFSLDPFTNDQTGTAIIIPYIDEPRLLKGIFPEECGVSEETIHTCAWKDSVSEYIELALQRWYAPRLFNKHLDRFPEHKWLMARVNGKAIRQQDMRRFFVLVQDLYNSALSENSGIEFVSQSFPMIKTIKIPSTKVDGEVAGHLAVARVTKKDFGPSDSIISPYVYLRLFTKTMLNDPIVMFARTPGMILSYRIDGQWAKGLIKPEGDDEFVVMFFVPKCEAKLKTTISVPEFRGVPLGEYLRKCEKSDHLDWEDLSNLTVITNIRSQIISKANGELRQDSDAEIEGSASKLSGKLGRRLLPSTKFGRKSPGGGGGGGNGGSGARSDNFSFEITGQSIQEDCVLLDATMIFSNVRKAAEMALFIEDESGSDFDADAWLSKISTKFPCAIKRIEQCAVLSKNTGVIHQIEGECSPNHPVAHNDVTEIRLTLNEDGIATGFTVSNSITNAVIDLRITVSSKERIYRLVLKEFKRQGGKI